MAPTKCPENRDRALSNSFIYCKALVDSYLSMKHDWLGDGHVYDKKPWLPLLDIGTVMIHDGVKFYPLPFKNIKKVQLCKKSCIGNQSKYYLFWRHFGVFFLEFIMMKKMYCYQIFHTVLVALVLFHLMGYKWIKWITI